jgi:hypothetical protein
VGGGGWKEKAKGQWIWSKFFIPMSKHRTTKPVEIVLRRGEEEEWIWSFDQDIACVEISQWNHFVQLIYTNKKKNLKCWRKCDKDSSIVVCCFHLILYDDDELLQQYRAKLIEEWNLGGEGWYDRETHIERQLFFLETGRNISFLRVRELKLKSEEDSK